MAGKKIKLTDVAREAGVSPSTVDRVLNGRPGVRQDTLQAVREALQRLGYAQNALSAQTGPQKVNLDIYLPRYKNEFFLELQAELLRHSENFKRAGNALRTAEIDTFDGASLVAVLDQQQAENGHAIVVVAHDAPEVRAAIDRAVSRGVIVLTLISDAPQSKRQAFVGIDNFAAGRTAGAILSRMLPRKAHKVGILVGHLGLRDHLDRRSGFEQAVSNLRPELEIVLIGAGRDDDEQSEKLVSAAVLRHSDMAGIYSIGAGNAGIVSAIKAHNRGDIFFVAHEHTAATREAIFAGFCDVVIVQDVAETARRVIDGAAALASGQEPTWSGPMQIGIMIKESLP
jgi:LacI family transcriptional regulator